MKKVIVLSTFLLTPCVSSCEIGTYRPFKTSTSFRDEFFFDDTKENYLKSIKAFDDRSMYPVDGNSMENENLRMGYYGEYAFLIDSFFKTENIDLLEYKERNYYVAFYRDKRINTDYGDDKKPYFASINYESYLENKNFWHSKNYKLDKKIPAHSNNQILDYLIRIVDIYKNGKKICSSFQPYHFKICNEFAYIPNHVYNSGYLYSRNITNSIKFFAINNIERNSNYYLQPFYHPEYGNYSYFSTRLETDGKYIYLPESPHNLGLNFGVDDIEDVLVSKKVVEEEFDLETLSFIKKEILIEKFRLPVSYLGYLKGDQ